MLPLRRLSERIQDRPPILASLLGAVAACGFEPLHVWPLTLAALAGLLALVSRAPNSKQAALIGWLFGLGHFIVGNNWIATAFSYQAKMPGWLGWIAVVGLACYLAVYPMLAALAAWHARRSGPALTLAFAGCWTASEWLRSWVFTGYVWNPLAMVALGPFDAPGLARIAPFTGTYGLSAVIVLLAGCWWLALRRKQLDPAGAAFAVLPLVAILWPTSTPVAPAKAGLAFTLVQPDIAQQDLDDPERFAGQFLKTTGLSTPTVPGETRLVLWPESGMPFYLATGYPRYYYLASDYEADPLMVRRRIGSAIGPGGLLLTGAVDLDMEGEQAVGARNVITAVRADGGLAGSYAKAHLVPGGEYLPLRWLLEPLGASRLVPGSIDFLPGPGPRTLDLGPWGKAGMQICYEIIFSGQVVDRENRPDYIFNPTNDGWFGSFGPPQHLAQARMRAIEEGLPVLRATTNGISAVIDADGIVRQSVPRGAYARLDGSVPPAHPPTLFARLGNMLALGLAAILLGLSALVLRRARG